jgi:hypothetical protein
MKKRWKWLLAGVAVPAVAIAVLWVDSYYRAVAAIRAEDERLAKDIAAFRSRLPPTPVAVHLKSRFMLEQGLSGRKESNFINEMNGLLYGEFSVLAVPENVSHVPLEAAVDALATLEEGLQESGFLFKDQGGLYLGDFLPETILECLLQRIRPKDLRPEELRRLSERLDRLMAARLSFAQILDAQVLLERAELLRILHLRADPGCFIRRPPGWKELFSWRIHVVKCLKELDDRHRFLRDEESDPLRNWYHGIDLKVPELEETRSRFEEAADALRREASSLAAYRFARVALALAIFRAEHGALPGKLDELVPDLLRAVPVHPFDHSPMTYEKGVLKIKPSEYGDWIQWP